ncbi:DUF1501 domain-containing protein [Roseiconus lacunae]|uniref:DUF1501 domain-containing protein n=1 Tax=Roseiconus lacunae TaxID=2605694 RepID=A0ABT7PDG4_9BACT|nr:DUF1501 domain-containing protein [Roseiconus lacunae]MDM4014547.1 DUF1501 domain-containing protein [Roseiconus lacunae]
MSMNQNYCDGMLRRDFVRIGAITGLLGTIGSQITRGSETAGQRSARPFAKSCILIWLDGGPTHLETFDPKPDAPSEIRGPFGSIATTISGVRVSECLPNIAKQMDKIAMIRSMTSPLGEHNFGTHYMMTGYKPSPVLDYPPVGAMVASRADQTSVLPEYVVVPQATRNINSHGFLPAKFAPFEVGGNPGDAGFRVRDLDLVTGMTLSRLSRRTQFVEALNRLADSDFIDEDLRRASRLISSPEAKQAFELQDEPDTLRQRYGRGGGDPIGQSCLLARRLIERGVDFVTVHSGGWDTHQDLTQLMSRFPGDRNAKLPSLDRAVGTLLDDLSERGLLEQTLVMVMGEFGRTPKVNTSGGRDHWPNVFSVLLAGGGVPGGQVIGRSDSLGESPADRAITPSDLTATVYSLLGIDPSITIQTPGGRSVRLAPDGASAVLELIRANAVS